MMKRYHSSRKLSVRISKCMCSLKNLKNNTRDKCGNPVEAAGFRATMKMLALRIESGSKEG